MIFNNCESCSKVGTRVCGCENPPRFFCDAHAINHITSRGKHSFQTALQNLTPSEISAIEDAYNNYRLPFLRQIIEIRDSRIEKLLREIRRVEEECSSIIKAILSGPIAKDVRQVLSYQALQLFSDSSVVRALLNLKHTSDFSSPKILDLFSTLNSSNLSSFSSFFSTPSFYTQSSTVHVQASSTPNSSTQANSSQKSPTVDLTSYRWELMQEQTQKYGIRSIAVSECEKYVAYGNNYTIEILELQTLRTLHTLNGHTESVSSISFLGNKLVSGSYDSTIKIWEEDRCERTLNLHTHGFGLVTSVCVSSCKRLIVSGSHDMTAVVFRLEDNKTLHILKHSNSVNSVAFSPDNKEIVSGSGYANPVMGGKAEIRIWKTETGELLKTLNAHYNIATCIKFSGKFIVSSSLDCTVKIWNRDKSLISWFWDKKEPLFTFVDHTEGIVSVDARDNLVAYIDMDDRIIVRDIRSGTVLQTLQAHGSYEANKHGSYTQMDLKILEGGKFIVSGGADKKLKVWRRVN